MAMVRRVQSVLCVDTNFINWLRCQGPEGYRLSGRCKYVPNYADLNLLPITTRGEGQPLSIIASRRFEEKRGTALLLDSLAVLWRNNVPFRAHISTVGGLAYLKRRRDELGISNVVSISEDSMDAVLARYGDYHVAAVPTLWSEGTSFACVEALAAGLPVVCTAVGGLGNLVVPNFNGFVVQPAAETFAGALQALTDTTIWQTMHTNALSMRESLGLERWKRDVASWLAA
jgi:glycosyltransferase involved in cell wall biosynthesis